MSILNHETIRSEYFHQQDRRCDDAMEIDVNGATLRCHYHRPNPAFPTLVHFHGNAESVSDYVDIGFPDLIQGATRGMNVLLIEYRGYGESTGEADLVTMLSDGEAVLDALKIDPASAIAYGRSIGSLYAIELAHRCPTLAGLIIDSGIAYIQHPFLGSPKLGEVFGPTEIFEINAEIGAYFDHEAKMRDFPGRVLVLHTKRDRLIDVEHAYQLYRWAGTRNKIVRVYDEGDHRTIFEVNQQDILYSISDMADKAFRQCRLPRSRSMPFLPTYRMLGVVSGCPIENAKQTAIDLHDQAVSWGARFKAKQVPANRPG